MNGLWSGERRRCRLWRSAVSMIAIAGALAACAACADPGTTERVSVSSDGDEGEGISESASISADGRFVAFESCATNLVDDDGNGHSDVFVRDRELETTVRVSINSSGEEGDDHSYDPSISADGRFVAFRSRATNLVPGDGNWKCDVFVHDRDPDEDGVYDEGNGTTARASISSSGVEGNHDSYNPSISADGRFVAFESYATNLVDDDDNGHPDVFVHHRESGTTERVSTSSSGVEGNHDSNDPSISADGQFVAFESYSSNLVSGDNNGKFDVFVHDRESGTTERVSISSSDEEGHGDSFNPSISADGRSVAFDSDATDLVSGDTNNCKDVFVRDRQAGTTERVSVSYTGAQGNGGDSREPSISADGRFVAFSSRANDLVGQDTNGREDVFVRDREYPWTERVSVSTGDAQGNDDSLMPSISADGRYVAFESEASNLVDEDENEWSDIFVHEREALYYDVSGTVSFELLAGTPPPSVKVRVTWYGWLFGNYEAALGPSGEYTLSLPSGPLTLSIKHTHWLRQTIPADSSAGPAFGIDFSLVNGDASDDNSVDIMDLNRVLTYFGGSDPMADLDGSGMVDIADLNIVFINFGKVGDS
jgi:Tol biopolymer transport system component